MFLGFCLVVITKNFCISVILTNATLVQGGISGVLGKHGHVIMFPLKLLHRSPPNGFYRNSDGTFSPKPRPLLETLTIQIVKDNAGE